MDYRAMLETLSECGLGVVVLTMDTTIVEVNEAGDRLLHGRGKLIGQRLNVILPALCAQTEGCIRVGFGRYVALCSTPDVDNLPASKQLLVFRDATPDARCAMLMEAVNRLDDGIILCDEEARVWMLNDSAVQMDALLVKDVLGERIDDIYFDASGNELLVPQTIRDRTPRINVRQQYQTRFGRDVDIVCSCYPVVQEGRTLGGYSVMKDWSTIDDLSRTIIDLQEKLVQRKGKTRKKDQNELGAKYTFHDIVSVDSRMRTVINQCRRAARTNSPIMIYGETGTGKELFAQSIHNASERSGNPFLAINCAAIPETLLESMLFGTEKGAYTGAEQRPGLFEQADGGTLLLDEINSMQISLQAKLLRVLQEGTVRRVGGTHEIAVDVRVLSNINIPPYQAIAENKLRADLFYRLGVVNIHVPALRERQDDIPLLAKTFLLRCSEKMGRDVRSIDKDVLRLFNQYRWPGNVRELQHAIEHSMNVLPDEVLSVGLAHLPEHVRTAGTVDTVMVWTEDSKPRAVSPPPTIFEQERERINDVLRAAKGNISEAARRLNISRQNLQYRMKKYGIDVSQL